MEYFRYVRQYMGHQPLILPGSVVLICDEVGEVLLQHRPEGKWGLPGGLMELGESFEQVAEREVFEEMGIRMRNLRLLHVFSGEQYYTQAPNGDEFYSVTAVFLTKEIEGQIVLNKEETLEVRYFACYALPENIVGSHRDFIRQFRQDIES